MRMLLLLAAAAMSISATAPTTEAPARMGKYYSWKRPPGGFVMATWQSLDVLERVNKQVNAEIIPVTDKEHYGYDAFVEDPADKKGDCDDYTMTKRKRLIEAGWPRDTLVVSIVELIDLKTKKGGSYHAVLMARMMSSTGSPFYYVLDNRYQYVKRTDDLLLAGYFWIIVDVDVRSVSSY